MNHIYYLRQKPVEPIEFSVCDERGKPRNLSAYSGASVVFIDPEGEGLTGGVATITDAANGKIKFVFEGETIFTEVGKYQLQLLLHADDRADYAERMTIEVEKGWI